MLCLSQIVHQDCWPTQPPPPDIVIAYGSIAGVAAAGSSLFSATTGDLRTAAASSTSLNDDSCFCVGWWSRSPWWPYLASWWSSSLRWRAASPPSTSVSPSATSASSTSGKTQPHLWCYFPRSSPSRIGTCSRQVLLILGANLIRIQISRFFPSVL